MGLCLPGFLGPTSFCSPSCGDSDCWHRGRAPPTTYHTTMFRFYSLGCGLEPQPPFRCLRLQHTTFSFLQQIHRVVFSPHELSYCGGLIFIVLFLIFPLSGHLSLYAKVPHVESPFSLQDSCVSPIGRLSQDPRFQLRFTTPKQYLVPANYQQKKSLK